MHRRATTLLLPTLVVANFLLYRFGGLDGRAAFLLPIAAELLLIVVFAAYMALAVRHYRRDRRDRADGHDAWEAIEVGLATVLPHRLARLVAIEPKMWASLWLFARRRRLAPTEFAYHRRSPIGALLVVVVLTAPVELLLFELFIPWSWLRWVLIALALDSLIWMIGLYASLRVLPHRLGDEALRLRSGLLGDAVVPYPAIAAATVDPKRPVGGGEGSSRTPRPARSPSPSAVGPTSPWR